MLITKRNCTGVALALAMLAGEAVANPPVHLGDFIPADIKKHQTLWGGEVPLELRRQPTIILRHYPEDYELLSTAKWDFPVPECSDLYVAADRPVPLSRSS
ncbi:MAG: hypothetical protein ABI702_00425 [Burkholderiales bacterium]